MAENQNNINNNEKITVDTPTGFSDVQNNKDDIEAINNRAKNEMGYSKNFRGNDQKIKTKENGLEKKEGLEEEKKQTEEKQKNKEKNSSSSIKDKINSKIDSKNPISNLKKKLKKIKMSLIIAGVAVGVIVLLFLVSFFLTTMDVFFNSITTFYGIPASDTNTKEPDGLLGKEEYTINPETGEAYSSDELVKMLNEDSNCSKITFWTGIKDWFSGFGGQFGDICSFIRYINKRTNDWEEEYSMLKLDRALPISSIFYGYAAQADYYDYYNPLSVKDKVPAGGHYDSLIDVLSDGTLVKDDLNKIIDNAVADTSYEYFEWQVDEIHNKKGEVIGAIGSCKKTYVTDVNYSLLRWNIFMRFGETAATTYDELIRKKKAYLASDEECYTDTPDSELISKVSEVATPAKLEKGSINYARKYLFRGLPENLELFEQKADVIGSKKDIFTPYTSKWETIEFDYKNGFAYERYPLFKRAINDPSNKITYDDAITPKIIESLLQVGIDKKPAINDVLQLQDQDQPNRYSKFHSWSSVPGAYCPDYVSVPFNEIKVTIKDCNGQVLTETDFKDYIMGVAYGEVSDKNDDYVKAQMVAALSYSLHRRENYTKVPNITMRSGNCDQVYCPMKQGCSSQISSVDCGGFKCTSYVPGGGGYHPIASEALYQKYSRLYDEASQFLLVKDGTVFNASYVSTVQNKWYQMASQGMSFTQILQEHYGPEGAELIQCTNMVDNNADESEVADKKVGNKATEEYPKVSQDYGKYYGFAYNDEPSGRPITINPEWKKENITTINTNCSSWNKTFEVNKQAKNKYAIVFSKMCDMIEEGVKLTNGTICKYTPENFQGGVVFEEKTSASGLIDENAYGIVQKWNYDKTYIVNGKQYKPYAATATLSDYTAFVEAIGKEEDCKNVNYILYKYAYQPAGFTWGGIWGRNGYKNNYNGMMYRINY